VFFFSCESKYEIGIAGNYAAVLIFSVVEFEAAVVIVHQTEYNFIIAIYYFCIYIAHIISILEFNDTFTDFFVVGGDGGVVAGATNYDGRACISGVSAWVDIYSEEFVDGVFGIVGGVKGVFCGAIYIY